MAQHDDSTRLRHMLDHAREAVHFAGGKRRADLDQDRLLTLALTRLLEIIGEAAARVTQTTRTRHPQIPWPQITGLRNRLIHGYDQIRLCQKTGLSSQAESGGYLPLRFHHQLAMEGGYGSSSAQ